MSTTYNTDDAGLEFYLAAVFSTEPTADAQDDLERRLGSLDTRGRGNTTDIVSTNYTEVTGSYAIATVRARGFVKHGSGSVPSAFSSCLGDWADQHGTPLGSLLSGTTNGLLTSRPIVADTDDRLDPIREHLEVFSSTTPRGSGGAIDQSVFYVLTPERRLTDDEVALLEEHKDRLVAYRSPKFRVTDVSITPVGIAFYLPKSVAKQRKRPTAKGIDWALSKLPTGHTAIGDLDDAEFWTAWERGAVADVDTAAVRDRVEERIETRAQNHGLDDATTGSTAVDLKGETA